MRMESAMQQTSGGDPRPMLRTPRGLVDEQETGSVGLRPHARRWTIFRDRIEQAERYSERTLGGLVGRRICNTDLLDRSERADLHTRTGARNNRSGVREISSYCIAVIAKNKFAICCRMLRTRRKPGQLFIIQLIIYIRKILVEFAYMGSDLGI